MAKSALELALEQIDRDIEKLHGIRRYLLEVSPEPPKEAKVRKPRTKRKAAGLPTTVTEALKAGTLSQG